jgi:hypothetical protein
MFETGARAPRTPPKRLTFCHRHKLLFPLSALIQNLSFFIFIWG